MAKCSLVFRKLVLDDRISSIVMKSLLDAIDIFEGSRGCIIDREEYLDTLINGVNICKENNALQIVFLDWLVYKTLRITEDHIDDSHEYLEKITRKTLAYLLKLINRKPDADKAYISFDSISNNGELTLILEDHEMIFKDETENDIKELMRRVGERERVVVTLREHLSILNELDKRLDHLIDYPKLIIDIISLLNRKIEDKIDVKRAIAGIELKDYLLGDVEIYEHLSDEPDKSNTELLLALAIKLMETVIATGIYHHDKMHYTPLPVDSAGTCVFVADPIFGNINIKEMGFF